jgi:hypothetical protein
MEKPENVTHELNPDVFLIHMLYNYRMSNALIERRMTMDPNGCHSEVAYLIEGIKMFGGGSPRDYASMGWSVKTYAQSLFLRAELNRLEDVRRFPEYRCSHTISTLGLIWERVTGKQLKHLPQAIDLGSEVVAMVYGLDDVMDKPGFNRRHVELSNGNFLAECLKELEIGGVSGQEIFSNMLATLSLDYRSPYKQELLQDILNYLDTWVDLHRNGNGGAQWTFDSALDMRRKVSQEFGAILGKVFSYAVDGVPSEDGIKVIEMMGLAGQFHDDLWDLVDEEKDNTHNMFLLLSQQYPSERESLRAYLGEVKSGGQDIPSTRMIQKLAPQTFAMYLEILHQEIEKFSGSTENLELKNVGKAIFKEFVPMYNSIACNPQKYIANKIRPEKINSRNHVRTSLS